jgi:hypothetical protein
MKVLIIAAVVLSAAPAWAVQYEYTEPTTNDCSAYANDPSCPTILDDLAFTTVYYKIDNQAVQTIMTAAPSVMGGAHHFVDIPTATSSKKLVVWSTATDTAGQESVPTPTLTKQLKGRGKP